MPATLDSLLPTRAVASEEPALMKRMNINALYLKPDTSERSRPLR